MVFKEGILIEGLYFACVSVSGGLRAKCKNGWGFAFDVEFFLLDFIVGKNLDLLHFAGREREHERRRSQNALAVGMSGGL